MNYINVISIIYDKLTINYSTSRCISVQINLRDVESPCASVDLEDQIPKDELSFHICHIAFGAFNNLLARVED